MSTHVGEVDPATGSDHRPSARGPALSGVLATAAGLAVTEAAARLLPLVPSPLDALGQVLVSWLPGPVVTAAIELLGAANRAVLLLASVLVALLLGAAVGRLGARSYAGAVGAITVVGLVAVLATATQPGAALPLVLLVVLAGGAVTAGLLARLLRLLGRLPAPIPALPSPTDPPVDRRGFLRLGGATAAGAAGLGLLSRWDSRGGATALEDATRPAPRAAAPLPAVPASQDLATRVADVTPALTPTDRFFRIDTAVVLPRVDVATWQLRVTGLVERELVLTYDDLLARDLVEVDATIACVSNEVGGDLIGTARWTGVPLVELLDEARPTRAAEQVLGRSVDGFTAGFPLELAREGRDALVAVAMNGETLPLRHGFPARLVVPGLFGYVSATKWLADIELTRWEGVDGYWIPRGWSKRGPVKTGARIDRPGRGEQVPAGEVVVAGVAWAPTRGISRVEVLLDGAVVAEATLVEPLSRSTWVQWYAPIEVPPGGHRLTVRATDGTGAVQAEGPAPPAPDGAEGWPTLRIEAV
ncbi:MAG: molybdopterin-dependent oxidoreductase [Nitriliruptoraceae bacterium]